MRQDEEKSVGVEGIESMIHDQNGDGGRRKTRSCISSCCLA